MKSDRKNWGRRRLGACLVAAALTATVVPTWSYADNAIELDGNAITASSVSGDTATASPETPGTSPIAPINENEGMTVKYKKYDAQGTASTNVPEVERTDAKPMPEDGRLVDGCYYLNANETYDKRIEVVGTVDLVLGNEYTLTANKGIHVPENAVLNICPEAGYETGRLFAYGAGSAGIGGDKNCGVITIHGGRIEATGSKNAAGIGGGKGGNAGSITIHDGLVTSTGGDGGSGIGCGKRNNKDSEGGTVTIDGGSVFASAGKNGAGIGGGDDNHCAINIKGGKVHAYSDETENGAAIGGGDQGDGDTITISGGTVEAISGNDGAAIGGGDEGDGNTITISGGDITAISNNGAAIGGGQHSGNGGSIAISGGTVNATSGYGAAIGGGKGWFKHWSTDSFKESGDGGTITISGGVVDATSKGAFGIGAGGWSPDDSASDGFNHDGIGSAGTILVKDNATVTARGAYAGFGGDGGTVTIEGGSVTAEGMSDKTLSGTPCGSGIFFLGKTGKLNISSGSVAANGKDSWPGIGLEGGGEATITGGTLTATGDQAAAIGARSGKKPKGTLNVSGAEAKVETSSKHDSAIGSHEKAGLDVHVKDGGRLSAQVEKDKKPLSVSSFDIYENAMVRVLLDNKMETVPESVRETSCQNVCYTYVSVEPRGNDAV